MECIVGIDQLTSNFLDRSGWQVGLDPIDEQYSLADLRPKDGLNFSNT